ncbi:Major Facilitator Superfamily protein [Sporobacter termitidis DSM 10068]|uniref:Major Facilitator Superfamily protein n=1 Tax=Sporobacter termitidis DSM 10068 TaxID=1123282 RepID=A0A1M5Z7A0_9FIRM|nr:MFS transporter [Sporobacter termitidis]SHI20054.1 Major Facilitator Superfamily protein [Sporobacter termitidis DSM 10068]
MAKMSRRNRTIFLTVMAAALMQMVQFALTPGIARIQTEVFPQYPLSVIQTALTLPSLFSIVFSLVSSFITGKGWVSKKACVVIGLGFITVTSLVAMLFHTQFWHLCMYSILIGTGMGFYIPTSASIMFDNFNEEECRMSVGAQSSFINLGGIIMSVGGGMLASLVWFGGYLMLLIGVPIVIFCFIGIPNDKKEKAAAPAADPAGQSGRKRRGAAIPLDIFYYAVITFIFLMIYTVCGTNISSHLQAANVGNTATAGIAIGVQMAGGVCMGLLFNKVSAKLRDYSLALAFVIVFVGYTIINLGQRYLALDFIGIFITGTAISIIVPQTLFSTSSRVNAANSAAATAIVNTIFPGLGSFFSPGVFTTLTTALGGDSTSFRYEFVGIVSLFFGVVLVGTTLYRSRKEREGRSSAEPAN